MIRVSGSGVTVVASSGDDGALTTSGSACLCQYGPSFPASNPYVTAVGATQGTNSLVPDYGSGERACQVNPLRTRLKLVKSKDANVCICIF